MKDLKVRRIRNKKYVISGNVSYSSVISQKRTGAG